jgi:hypothetical protein
MSFLPPIVSTYTRHGEFLRLLFLQETVAHFTATEMPSQHTSDKFLFCRAAFSFLSRPEEQSRTRGTQRSSSSAPLRINLNIEGPRHGVKATDLLRQGVRPAQSTYTRIGCGI